MSPARPTRHRGRAALALVAASCLTFGACAAPRRAAPREVIPATVAAQEWPEALRTAQNAAVAHAYAAADSVLRAFAARFPGTPSSAESVYQRALLRLDTAGDSQAIADAIREVRSLLDAYIVGGPMQEHYAEAVLLRRVAVRMDSLRAGADAPRVVTVPSAAPNALAARDSVIRARDDELTRLRAELEQTKAELERIRRRIAPTRP